MHPGLHNPQAGTGMQVHVPYTVYAHFFLVRQILSGAGVKKVDTPWIVSRCCAARS